jgi:transcription elongation factor Elf1
MSKKIVVCGDCGSRDFELYNDKGLLSCEDCGQFFDTTEQNLQQPTTPATRH